MKVLVKRRASDNYTNPWHGLSSLRLNQASKHTLRFNTKSDETLDVDVTLCNGHNNQTQASPLIELQIAFNGDHHTVKTRKHDNQVQYEINGQWRSARVIEHNNILWIYDNHGESQLSYVQSDFNQHTEQAGSLTAPMNGTIIQIDSSPGQVVKAGDVLMIMEAMKMEHAIKAPMDGTIKEICFNIGDLVNESAMLIEMDEA